MSTILTAVATTNWPQHNQVEDRDQSLDHFVHRDGEIFAGTHLIIDLWEAKDLDCLERMETALRSCVEACSATLLHIHLHHFTPNGGISGVAVLAESHISVHTWPEKNYAAFDVFMCGDSVPHKAIEILSLYFRPERQEILEERRGRIT
ncbi:adenosylmethionine decarboxylase [Litorivicinus sp.]|nr:adenosylmethionine decarboxylase [Litorivicinus sp.]MDC1207834.1 adenosylmethionine decarboxylase [Litorivicinus sp.]MDC1239686.1 adenosylmethionine decarboxylase [Litorivicinus sp.]MDC1466477.1 adenosylmethionine decarboxylase [Litorivicinus sp.]